MDYATAHAVEAALEQIIRYKSGKTTQRLFEVKLHAILKFGKLDTVPKEVLHAMIDWLISNIYFYSTGKSLRSIFPTI